MRDMKCPFCNGELVGTIGHPICRNQNCVMCDDPMPQDLWEELICTRKALEIAQNALKDIDALLLSRKFDIAELGRLNIIQYLVSRALKITKQRNRNEKNKSN